MAVAFDAVGPSSAGATSAASATLSWTHTCVGDGVALVVAVAVGDSNDSGVTMTAKLDPSGANTTITSLGSLIHSGASTAGFVALFGLPNVGTGAHTVTVTTSAAVDVMEGGSVSYTGAHLTSAFSAQQSFTQQGTAAPSITFTGSTAGNMISAGLAHGQTITSVSVGTSRWIRNVNSSSAGGNGAQADKAAGGSQAITWAATSDWCGIAAVEVLATSAPAVPDTSLYRPSWVLPRIRNLLRSPFLQAPATYWPPPIPLASVLDAENGTNGVTVTQANFPATQAPTIGTGSIFRFDTAAALQDTLGYYVKAADSFQSAARYALPDNSTVWRLRMSFRLLVAPTSTQRTIWGWRHAGGPVSKIMVNSSNQVTVLDSTNSDTRTGPTLTVGTDYDISQLIDVSAGTLTLKVYLKNTTTQVGSTLTVTGYNLGVQAISLVDTGCNDAFAAGDLEFYWDTARVESNMAVEFDPLSSSGVTATPAVVATIAALPAPTVQTGSTVTAATIATAVALPGVTASGGATTQPAAIATPVAVPAPSLSTGSKVAPTTVATTATLPAPAVATGSTAAPSSAATVTALPAPSISTAAGATATPATVATVAAVGAPAVSVGSVVTAATLATVAALPAPTVKTGATVTASTVTTVAALSAPSVSAGTTTTPAVIAAVASVGASAVSTGSQVTAVAVATVTALPVPTVKTGATPTPATIATPAALPTPAVSAGGNATITPAVVATSAAVPSVALSTGQRVSASAIASTSALPAPTIRTGATTAPAAVATAAAVGGPALSTGVRVTATTLATSSALPAPTVTAETRTVPAVISTASTLPVPTIQTGSTIAAQAIASYATVGAVIVSTITPAVYGTGSVGHANGSTGRTGNTGLGGTVGHTTAATGRGGTVTVASGAAGSDTASTGRPGRG